MSTSPPLSIVSLFDQDAVRTGGDATGHAVFKLLAGPAAEKRPALTVVFCIDMSSSMQGPPIEAVVASMTRLLGLLEEQDQAGVVLFADEATVLQSPAPVTPGLVKTLTGRLHRLTPFGWTNIEAGLRTAAGVMPVRQTHERQAVLLLSDGEPNRGATRPEDLADVVASYRASMAVSTLGYGPAHNERVLHAMSEAGAGQYAYIADPVECAAEIARAVGAQAEVVADQVTLTLRPGEGVEIDAFVASPAPRFGADGLRLALPDALAHDEQALVLRLNVNAPREGGEHMLLDATLRYRAVPGAEVHEVPCALSVRVRPGDPVPVREARVEVVLAEADEARAAGWKLADAGHFDGAASALRQVMAKMEAIEGHDAQDGSRLSEAYEQLVDEVLGYETKPSVEDYRNFRRVQMGMKMSHGAQHVSDRKAQGIAAEALREEAGSVRPARLRVQGAGGEQVVRLGLENTIGRVAGNDIVLGSGAVSKRHARIVAKGGRYVLVDLKTTNGSYLNGQRVSAPRVLQPGDEIAVGDRTLVFETD